MAVCAGCGSPEPVIVPVTRLATAPLVRPTGTLRGRISYDRPLPGTIARELSDEFTLVILRNNADLTELRRGLGISDSFSPDFARGLVVGIVAMVGEPVENQWPIRIDGVRIVYGLGWVDATLEPGLYHPLQTAGYVELAYVPNLSSVAIVQINHRMFLLPGNTDPGSMLLSGNADP